MTSQQLGRGFATPAKDAAFAFRGIMNAMARPGRIEQVAGVDGPKPLSQSAATVLLTLCDGDTKVYLAPTFDTDTIRNWIAFHTGAPLSSPEAADFAVGAWAELKPLARFRTGTAEYPDQSATLIVETESLSLIHI